MPKGELANPWMWIRGRPRGPLPMGIDVPKVVGAVRSTRARWTCPASPQDGQAGRRLPRGRERWPMLPMPRCFWVSNPGFSSGFARSSAPARQRGGLTYISSTWLRGGFHGSPPGGSAVVLGKRPGGRAIVLAGACGLRRRALRARPPREGRARAWPRMPPSSRKASPTPASWRGGSRVFVEERAEPCLELADLTSNWRARLDAQIAELG